jgi:hypothetical protein
VRQTLLRISHRWMISHPLRAVLTKSCRFDPMG